MPSRYNLSEIEYMFMQYLWNADKPLTASEIQSYFSSQGYHWAIQTVHSFLTRLVKKGALSHDTLSPKHFYPISSFPQYISNYLWYIFQKDFNGSLEDFVVALNGLIERLNNEQQQLQDFRNHTNS